MEDKFADKFRIESERRADWDYSRPGTYFITICTMNHNKFFGKIVNNQMCYSQKGFLAYKFLINIPIHFINVNLIEYVIMPNHVHILLDLKDIGLKQKYGVVPKNNCRDAPVARLYKITPCRDAINRVSTLFPNVSTLFPNVSTKKQNQVSIKIEKMQMKNPMNNLSLGTVIRWYKAKVSKEIRNDNLFFAWQSRYYDEIIESEKRLRIIRYYIKNNPRNWEKDNLFR